MKFTRLLRVRRHRQLKLLNEQADYILSTGTLLCRSCRNTFHVVSAPVLVTENFFFWTSATFRSPVPLDARTVSAVHVLLCWPAV